VVTVRTSPILGLPVLEATVGRIVMRSWEHSAALSSSSVKAGLARFRRRLPDTKPLRLAGPRLEGRRGRAPHGL